MLHLGHPFFIASPVVAGFCADCCCCRFRAGIWVIFRSEVATDGIGAGNGEFFRADCCCCRFHAGIGVIFRSEVAAEGIGAGNGVFFCADCCCCRFRAGIWVIFRSEVAADGIGAGNGVFFCADMVGNGHFSLYECLNEDILGCKMEMSWKNNRNQEVFASRRILSWECP